jgi:hypothetical protein
MIKIFYFDTGLTIIADEKIETLFLDENVPTSERKRVVWEYPMIFQHQITPDPRTGEGKVSVMFQPMFMFSKEPKIIPKNLSSILFESEADEKMKEKYQAIVTQARSAASGLVIPGGPAIHIKPNIHKPSTNS